MVALEQRYCNRKARCVMARPGESLKNNNAEIWRETHLSRASEVPKRTGSSNPFRSINESVLTSGPFLCEALIAVRKSFAGPKRPQERAHRLGAAALWPS